MKMGEILQGEFDHCSPTMVKSPCKILTHFHLYQKKIENGQFDLTFDVICWGLPGFCSISFFW